MNLKSYKVGLLSPLANWRCISMVLTSFYSQKESLILNRLCSLRPVVAKPSEWADINFYIEELAFPFDLDVIIVDALQVELVLWKLISLETGFEYLCCPVDIVDEDPPAIAIIVIIHSLSAHLVWRTLGLIHFSEHFFCSGTVWTLFEFWSWWLCPFWWWSLW